MSKPEFTVSAAVQPLADRTDPDQDRYAFAYTITIRNTGDVPAQLIARHWVITDARGHVEEVRGLAVVGHQPLLQPGEQFQYTSWAQISTPQGSMRGSFFCFTHDAHPFEAVVEEFGLTTSSSLH
jgi:ApaG protein